MNCLMLSLIHFQGKKEVTQSGKTFFCCYLEILVLKWAEQKQWQNLCVCVCTHTCMHVLMKTKNPTVDSCSFQNVRNVKSWSCSVAGRCPAQILIIDAQNSWGQQDGYIVPASLFLGALMWCNGSSKRRNPKC